MRTYVLAEVGSCHGGTLASANRLLALSAKAGASGVKAQFWSSAARLAARRHAGAQAQQMYETFRVPELWLPALRRRADELGVEFVCSVYLPEDAAIVARHAHRLKVASFEATDLDMLRACGRTGRPLVISTGMMDETQAHRVIRKAAEFTRELAVLHCTSAYPAPVEQANLACVGHLSDYVRWATDNDEAMGGLSDHTGWPMMGAWAVLTVPDAAICVEVHVRLDGTPADNPDYPHALTPLQFREYVHNIQRAEAALGTGEKCCQPAEAHNRRYVVEGGV